MEKNQRLDHLDSLRGLAILLVVGIHAEGYADPGAGRPFPLGRRRLADDREHGRPGFLPGRWVSLHQDDGPDGLVRLLRVPTPERMRLLVPWIVFSVLYAALRAVFEAVGFFSHRIVLGRPPDEVTKTLYESGIAMQMLLPAVPFPDPGRVVRHPLSGPPAPGWVVVLALILFSGLLRFSHIPLGSDPVTDSRFYGFRFYLVGIIARKYDGILRASGHRLWPVLALSAAGLNLCEPWDCGPTTQYVTVLRRRPSSWLLRPGQCPGVPRPQDDGHLSAACPRRDEGCAAGLLTVRRPARCAFPGHLGVVVSRGVDADLGRAPNPARADDFRRCLKAPTRRTERAPLVNDIRPRVGVGTTPEALRRRRGAHQGRHSRT